MLERIGPPMSSPVSAGRPLACDRAVVGQRSRPRLCLPEDVRFREATRRDDPFLYSLLVERYEQETANISGMARGELPTFEQHVEHLDRSPYKRMEIIVVDGADVGMMYLGHENVAGCFVLKEHVARGVGLAACYRFFASCGRPVIGHFNPSNRPAYRTVERLGFVLTERLPHKLTYELRGPLADPYRRLRQQR